MKNKHCSVDQRINGQRTYQRTTEVVPGSARKWYLTTGMPFIKVTIILLLLSGLIIYLAIKKVTIILLIVTFPKKF
jgi:hypothetical protein